MFSGRNTWALVLAAGEGTRLRTQTTASCGTVIPKQFCSLRHGRSLLENALGRAGAVATTLRISAIVAKQHRCWWEPQLCRLPAENLIVQPENRGTAHAVLLSLLHIVECDPGAQLVLLPSDHHVRHEAILARALRQAVEQLRWRFDETVLLGFEPEEADPELGYILPGRSDGRGALEVAQFVEKPAIAQTHELIGRGGLWNAFIMASTAQALLGLFRRRVPGIVKEMRAAVQRDRASPMPGSAIAKLYDRLPTIDFSRDILQGQETQLRVLPVASCGWSDLGTPERVARALQLVADSDTENASEVDEHPGCLNLAFQHQAARSAATTIQP
jgi:mannose-1-phosphate guanylyltransferase